MKKILFALAAVALLFATSCKKESINPAVDIPEGSFLATIDNGANPQNAPRVSDGMTTKTTIDNNRYVIWESGDQISINGSIYTTSTAGNSVVFSGGNATGTTFHAFYPASIAGEGAAGTFPATQTIEYDNQNNAKVTNLPMYACSTNNQLTFNNICAVLKINIPTGVTASSIEISADQVMNGAFRVDELNSKYTAVMTETASATNTKITVNPQTGKSFASESIVYVALPAQSYTSFIVNMTWTNGKVSGGDSILVKNVGNITLEVNKLYNTNINFRDDIFHFTALEDGCTIRMAASGSAAPTVYLEYCTYTASTGQYSTWEPFTVGTTTVNLAQNDKAYFRAPVGSTNSAFSDENSNANIFSINNTVNVGGNIMYLLDNTPSSTTQLGSNAFSGLFFMCPIVDASKLILSAKTLSTNCYGMMFAYCQFLTTPPVVQAMTLGENCCASMFMECASLTAAPELPATTLAKNCYMYMFMYCSSLVSVPYVLPATNLEEYCYAGMFICCTALVTAPVLPALTLADHCYDAMFNVCSSLNSVTMMATDVSAKDCIGAWLTNAGSAGSSILYVDPTMTNNSYIIAQKGNFTIQAISSGGN